MDRLIGVATESKLHSAEIRTRAAVSTLDLGFVASICLAGTEWSVCCHESICSVIFSIQVAGSLEYDHDGLKLAIITSK